MSDHETLLGHFGLVASGAQVELLINAYEQEDAGGAVFLLEGKDAYTLTIYL